MNQKQRFVIEKKYREKVFEVCPSVTDESGIYIMTREEDGFKFCYVGQAKHLCKRIVQHLMEYKQHVDKSLKKHKLYSDTNKTGWKIGCLPFPIEKLDEMEQHYIRLYANNSYQMLNKTSGSQSTGKHGISENKPPKGYYDGVAHGEKKTQKKVKEYFDKYLDYKIKGDPNKIKERKFNEFTEFLTVEESGEK